MTDLGSQLWEAATLMVTGMTMVFIFLTILVFLVRLMSKLVPEEQPPQPQAATRKIKPASSAVKPQVAAAISAAVHKYRQSNS